MSKNATAILIAAVLVVIGGLLFYKSHTSLSSQVSLPSSQNQFTPSVTSSEPPVAEATESAVITIGANGFNPTEVIVVSGATVTWKNTDTKAHQVNSNPHPTHTGYPPLNTIGLLNPGQEKSLTFPTPGSYGFHDHLNPEFTGQITVLPHDFHFIKSPAP